jgi:hypothetical protein
VSIERWDPWREAAVAADGHIKLRTDTASTKVTLEATVRDVAISGQGRTSPYSSARDWTLLEAKAPGTSHLRLKIEPGTPGEKRLSWSLRNTFVGDKRFDNRFVVLANDPCFADSWLSDELRDVMRSAKKYRFTLSSGRAVARRDGFESEHKMLTRAMNALALLARSGRVLRRDWAHVAAVLGGDVDVPSVEHALDDAWTYSVTHNRARIAIAPQYGAIGRKRRHKRLYTRLRSERVAHTADCYMIYADAYAKTARPRMWKSLRTLEGDGYIPGYTIECQSVDRMSPRIEAQLPEMLHGSEAALVRADRDAIAVYLPGMVTDVDQLRPAIALVARLAIELEPGGAVGPYR